jgi:hypothetical protein
MKWNQVFGGAFIGLCSIVHAHRSELAAQQPATKPEFARTALRELASIGIPDGTAIDDVSVLPHVANIALESGDLEKARAYATRTIDVVSRQEAFDPDPGLALHLATMVLGRVALRLGDIDNAKDLLLKATDYGESPFLEIAGPSMLLASELLRRGERTAVLSYLSRCARLWPTSDHRPEKWIYEIEHGGLPDFGDNLSF